MTRAELKSLIEYECFRGFDKRPNFIHRFSIKHLHPNTNCMFLVRKMMYHDNKGGIHRIIAKLYFILIHRRYGCCIFPSAKIGKGLFIPHPVGIVIGKCIIGENFTIYQNSVIGVKHHGDEPMGLTPVIGNNVVLGSGSMVFGKVHVADNVVIGANSVVNKDISKSGLYCGCPAEFKR